MLQSIILEIDGIPRPHESGTTGKGVPKIASTWERRVSWIRRNRWYRRGWPMLGSLGLWVMDGVGAVTPPEARTPALERRSVPRSGQGDTGAKPL
jgi:hypothetical protein